MRSKRNERLGFGILMLIPAGVIAFAMATLLPNPGKSDQTIIVAFQVTEPQLLSRPPLHGAIRLRNGFSPDPYEVRVNAGGTISAREAFGDHCTGYIKSDPTFSLDYAPGVSALYISVEGTGNFNTTLVIHAPDQRWYCDDDSGDQRLDPGIGFQTPARGGYVIWVGSHAANSNGAATLRLSGAGN